MIKWKMLISIIVLTLIVFSIQPLVQMKTYAVENDPKIEDGIYYIESALDEKYVLDVSNASKEDGANIGLWLKNNGDNQKFSVKYLGNETYIISNENSKKVLDVYNNYKTPETNVEQYSSNNGDNQKWIIKSAGDGYYYLIGKASGLYLDVYMGKAQNGTNIQIYSKNEGKNQKFKFEPVSEQYRTKLIEEGTYYIESALDEKYVLDVSNASKQDSANISLWTKNNGDNQKFRIKYLDDQTCIITNVNSNKVIDVYNNNKKPETNVEQYSSNNGDNQKWIIKSAGDNCYYLESKASGLYMDVYGGTAKSGANIQIFTKNNGKNQKFKFKPVNEETEKTTEPKNEPQKEQETLSENEPQNQEGVEPVENTTAKGEKTIGDGIYYIKSALNESYVLDVPNGSHENEANIALWEDKSGDNQKFKIEYLGDGYYQITSVVSGKAVDVYANKKTIETNIQQYEVNGGDSQKWVIKDAGNGYYNLLAKSSSLYMDVYKGDAKNGANIQLYTSNGGNNQKFKFELTGTKTIDSGTYLIKSKLNTNYVLDVEGASSENCANVELWTSHDGSNQRFRIVYNARGFYKITIRHSKKALDILGGAGYNGANVGQYSENIGTNQKWVIEKDGDSYRFKSLSNGVYLNVQGNNAKAGSNINVATKKDEDGQKFYLERKSNLPYIDTSKYPGYKEKLESVLSNHPDWEVEFLYTGLAFNSAVSGECELKTRNLIYESYGGEWINGTQKYDNGHWYAASSYAVSYFMDPRNFLNDTDIFQFLDVNQFTDDAVSLNGIQSRVSSTYLADFASDIYYACRNQGVDPYYVIARLIQEQGSSGVGYWRIWDDGRYYYNPFNISANGNGNSEIRANSLRRAKSSGWDTMQKAIEGGIYFLKENYLENYQNTLYTNRFDIDSRAGGLYTHQYMQNVSAAYTEARSLRAYYNSDGKLDSNFTFIIPLYEKLDGAQTSEPSNSSEKYAMNVKTTGTYINLRSDANANSSVITTIANSGTVLLSVKRGINSDWQQVVTSDGTIGYMSGKYLEQIDDVKTCNYTAYIKTNDGNGCNVRIGPSTNLDAINAYSDGTKVTVIDNVTYKGVNGFDWYRIALPNGTDGFIPSKYLAN